MITISDTRVLVSGRQSVHNMCHWSLTEWLPPAEQAVRSSLDGSRRVAFRSVFLVTAPIAIRNLS